MKSRRWLLAALGIAVLAMTTGSMPGTMAQEGKKQERGLTFEIYKDNSGDFRWRLKAANGQVIGGSGQGYKAKADCQHAIDLIKRDAAKAKVEDLSAQ
jgi:uncharacterized protein YegP (UPF0339 family)